MIGGDARGKARVRANARRQVSWATRREDALVVFHPDTPADALAMRMRVEQGAGARRRSAPASRAQPVINGACLRRQMIGANADRLSGLPIAGEDHRRFAANRAWECLHPLPIARRQGDRLEGYR